jgi:hypothetical protein
MLKMKSKNETIVIIIMFSLLFDHINLYDSFSIDFIALIDFLKTKIAFLVIQTHKVTIFDIY